MADAINHKGQKFRSFSRWSQFVAMLTVQLSARSSLCDVVDNLGVQGGKLYHLGVKAFSRATLARCNEKQPHFFFLVNQGTGQPVLVPEDIRNLAVGKGINLEDFGRDFLWGLVLIGWRSLHDRGFIGADIGEEIRGGFDSENGSSPQAEGDQSGGKFQMQDFHGSSPSFR
ncbi:hypothetical protein C2E25_06955 [Geothermobacter hydrogeniphilus]|uniref:DUF4372 domain-containing protein n=1 Tax=Geothermobacter hydrogeniphilus TaxID=1969733 RepID=A0A2K2HAX4_9BACT|nr:hypothetical protein C2E25_06955 [Geothermobacter hydrogeniphilus]